MQATVIMPRIRTTRTRWIARSWVKAVSSTLMLRQNGASTCLSLLSTCLPGSNPKSGSQNSEDSDKYEWEVESSDDDDSFVWHVESDYDSDAGETARRLRSLASAVEDTPEIDKIAGLYKKRQWGKLNRKQQREIG